MTYSQKYLYDLINEYAYINTSYRTSLNDDWTLRGGVSYTFLTDKNIVHVDQIDEVEKALHAKVVVDGSLSDKVELKTGVEVIQRNYRYETRSSMLDDLKAGFNESILAGFAEADLYTSNKFVTRAGARVEYDNLIEKISIDPRLSLAYKTGAFSQVSFAYGTFRQSPKNEWLRHDDHLDPEKAQHYILNYQFIENKRTFRIETYYKRYGDLVKFIDSTPEYLESEREGLCKRSRIILA